MSDDFFEVFVGVGIVFLILALFKIDNPVAWLAALPTGVFLAAVIFEWS